MNLDKIFDSESLSHAKSLIKVLQKNNHKAYLVGGCLRDLYLGINPKDIDITTNATPEQIKKLFKRAYIIGKRFQLVHVYIKNHLLEVATFRQFGNQENNEEFNHNIFGTLEEDAFRRDFSINALYYDPINNGFLDYCNGVTDLDNKIIKSIGDPLVRFKEDPLRIIRAIRLAGKLNFEIAAKDKEAIIKLKDLLLNIPSARIFEEFLKLARTMNLYQVLKMLEDFKIKHVICNKINHADDPMVKIFTQNTNDRIASGKTLNPAFMFCILLWNENILKTDKSLFSFSANLGNILIPKKITAVMHVIWLNQKRFLQIKGKKPLKLLRQPFFRASLDFYEIRAQAGLADKELLQWWLDFVKENTIEK